MSRLFLLVLVFMAASSAFASGSLPLASGDGDAPELTAITGSPDLLKILRKRSAQFFQTYYPGSSSSNYECGSFGGCVIPPTQQFFGGQNTNLGLGFNQGYYGGAGAYNYNGFGFGKRRRRSADVEKKRPLKNEVYTKKDSAQRTATKDHGINEDRIKRSPGFFQAFYPGAQNNLIDCTVPGVCNGAVPTTFHAQQQQGWPVVYLQPQLVARPPPTLVAQQTVLPSQSPAGFLTAGETKPPQRPPAVYVASQASSLPSQQTSQPQTLTGTCTCPSSLYPGNFIPGTLTCTYPFGPFGGRKCKCVCSLNYPSGHSESGSGSSSTSDVNSELPFNGVITPGGPPSGLQDDPATPPSVPSPTIAFIPVLYHPLAPAQGSEDRPKPSQEDAESSGSNKIPHKVPEDPSKMDLKQEVKEEMGLKIKQRSGQSEPVPSRTKRSPQQGQIFTPGALATNIDCGSSGCLGGLGEFFGSVIGAVGSFLPGPPAILSGVLGGGSQHGDHHGDHHHEEHNDHHGHDGGHSGHGGHGGHGSSVDSGHENHHGMPSQEGKESGSSKILHKAQEDPSKIDLKQEVKEEVGLITRPGSAQSEPVPSRTKRSPQLGQVYNQGAHATNIDCGPSGCLGGIGQLFGSVVGAVVPFLPGRPQIVSGGFPSGGFPGGGFQGGGFPGGSSQHGDHFGNHHHGGHGGYGGHGYQHGFSGYGNHGGYNYEEAHGLNRPPSYSLNQGGFGHYHGHVDIIPDGDF